MQYLTRRHWLVGLRVAQHASALLPADIDSAEERFREWLADQQS